MAEPTDPTGDIVKAGLKTLLAMPQSRMIAQEGAEVLLVDFDLFVRGLSHFYYLFSKEKRVLTDQKTGADFFEVSVKREPFESDEFAKNRFYEVDILPAVSDIEEQLNYLEIEKETIEKTRSLLMLLKKEPYEYIIIDNRAGVDELIIETSRLSDMTISVSESDPISQTTNENLLRHLDSNKVGKIYTIVNKTRFLSTLKEYEKSSEQIRSDFKVAGQIPFDVDLFEKFGTHRFWDTVNSTRYAYALAESWNKISQREDFVHLVAMERFPKNEIWPGEIASPAFLNKIERLSIGMSLVCFIAYILYEFVVDREFQLKDIMLVYGVMFLAVPFIRRFVLFYRK